MHFWVTEVYEGGTFLSKLVKGLDLWAKSPRIKLCRVEPPPRNRPRFTACPHWNEEKVY